MKTKASLTENERFTILKSLSTREWEVANLALKGFSNKAIADELYITLKTVEFHLRNIFSKLGITKRIELINFFFSHEPLEWRKN